MPSSIISNQSLTVADKGKDKGADQGKVENKDQDKAANQDEGKV